MTNVPLKFDPPIKSFEFWYPVTDKPNIHGYPYWVYLPGEGNADDGWGYVTVGYWGSYGLHHGDRGEAWRDGQGNRLEVALWASMGYPEPPFLYEKAVSVEQALRDAESYQPEKPS